MTPSLLSTSIVGAPPHHVSSGAYAVDTILNELSRELVVNGRRYSRGSSGQLRLGSAMRVSKPGSANNSPRSSALPSKRRTWIGDGSPGKPYPQYPAMNPTYLPTPASESPGETFYERGIRPARPVSWHPSSLHNSQQTRFYQQGSSSVCYPYSAYDDGEILAGLQHLPPTPAVCSGYTSPAESFSPLSLPYSSFGSEEPCCPPNQPVRAQRQQPKQAPPFHPTPGATYDPAGTISQVPYLPALRVAGDPMAWESNPARSAMVNRPTAPPTPEDFACNLLPNHAAYPEIGTTVQQEKAHEKGAVARSYQPLIHTGEDQDWDNGKDEGEILYGLGLYDPPDHSKAVFGDGEDPTLGLLHQSTIFPLLGARDADRGRLREEESETGRGLGLKLEDAWEPPASEDEGEQDQDDDDDDGENRDG
ncbi:hypothetical protein VTK56DRAFT_694 [Thermocarpiscus australiensis]